MIKQIGRFFLKTYQGFTLIEILVAIAILSVAILGIIALLPVGYSQVTGAGRTSMLNHLGQDKIDELRAIPYLHSDLVNGIHPTAVEFPYDSDSTIPNQYSIRWTVTNNTPATRMKRVIVEVGYNQYNYPAGTAITSGLNQEIKYFETYVTEGPP